MKTIGVLIVGVVLLASCGGEVVVRGESESETRLVNWDDYTISTTNEYRSSIKETKTATTLTHRQKAETISYSQWNKGKSGKGRLVKKNWQPGVNVQQVWDVESVEILVHLNRGTLELCQTLKGIRQTPWAEIDFGRFNAIGGRNGRNGHYTTVFYNSFSVKLKRKHQAYKRLTEDELNPVRPGDRKCNTIYSFPKSYESYYDNYSNTFSVYQTKENEFTIGVVQKADKNYGSEPSINWNHLEEHVMILTVALGRENDFRYATFEQVSDRSKVKKNISETEVERRTTGGDSGLGMSTTLYGVTFSSANTTTNVRTNTTTSTTEKGGSYEVATKQLIKFYTTEPDRDDYLDLEFLQRTPILSHDFQIIR